MASTVRDQPRVDDPSSLDAPQRPAALSGLLIAGLVYGVGVVVCVGIAVIGWLASDAGSAASAIRAGAGFWLAGNGSGVGVGESTITVVPLGVPVLIVLGSTVAGRRLGSGEQLGVLAGCAAVGYGVATAITAAVASTDAVSFSPVRAGLIGCILVGCGAALGAASADGGLRGLLGMAPPAVRGVLVGAGASVASLLGVATLLVAYALVTGFGELSRTFDALGPGIVGGVVLGLLCILLFPNAVLLAAALLLGPGFAIGSGTSVTLTEVQLGDIPAIPLLAALPDPGVQPAWLSVLAILPVLAGCAGGYAAVRDTDLQSLYDTLTRGCVAGGGAGLLLGLGVMCAGGVAGPGRMSDVGAVMWCVPVAVVAMAVGGTAGAAVGHYRERRSNP